MLLDPKFRDYQRLTLAATAVGLAVATPSCVTSVGVKAIINLNVGITHNRTIFVGVVVELVVVEVVSAKEAVEVTAGTTTMWSNSITTLNTPPITAMIRRLQSGNNNFWRCPRLHNRRRTRHSTRTPRRLTLRITQTDFGTSDLWPVTCNILEI